MTQILLRSKNRQLWARLSLALLMIFAASPLSSCANPGKSGEKAEPEAEEAPFTEADANALNRSRIIIDFKFGERLRDVKGYIVGGSNQPTLTAMVDQPGRFLFAPMKAGSHDLILEAVRLADEPSQANQPVALRLTGVQTEPTGNIFMRELELKPLIQLSGEVRVLGAKAPQAGIKVSIPGTSFKTETDAKGQFTLAKIPEGHHQLQLEQAGFTPGLYEKRQYDASQVLPALTLFNDDKLLPIGVHYLGEPLAPETEASITVFLKRPLGMNLMRWSYSEDFKDASWMPYQSSFDIKLGSGQRQLYLQFSRDRQQLSSVFPLQLAAP